MGVPHTGLRRRNGRSALLLACSLSAVAPIFGPAPAAAQTTGIAVNDARFQEQVATMEMWLLKFFDTVIRSAALSAAHNDQRWIISNVKLEIKADECHFAPRAWPRIPVRPPEIVVGRIFLVVNRFVASAVWIEVARGFPRGAREKIETYVAEEILPFRDRLVAHCKDPTAEVPNTVRSYAHFFEAKGDNHVVELDSDPQVQTLGHQLGMQFAFVLLHEIGHHVLGHTVLIRFDRPFDEKDADGFAVNVFSRHQLPSYVAVGAFLPFLSSSSGWRDSSRPPRCRLVTLLKDEKWSRNDFTPIRDQAGLTDLSRFAPAIIRMKQEFLAAYDARC